MMADDQLLALKETASTFAGQHIAPHADLYDRLSLPPDVQQAMAKEGLYGIGIPVAHGGMGGGWLHMSVAGQALVENGRNLGCGLSWLMHTLIARFLFFGFGSDRQRNTFLPGIAAGAKIPCLAISEPGVGGHPKRLATVAREHGSAYLLSGEKAYLTNGPIADLFVVLAITAEEGQRKSYTAFIVDAETPGLKKTGPLDLGFLRPCPHGGIILDGCEVDRGRILGRLGYAYTDMALPFRQIEDVMVMGLLVGGIRAQITLLASSLKEQGIQPGKDIASSLGEVVSSADSLEILAREAAAKLDSSGIDHPGLVSLVIFMRRVAQGIQAGLNDIIVKTGVTFNKGFASLANDLTSSMRIAGNVSRIKQEKLGISILS